MKNRKLLLGLDPTSEEDFEAKYELLMSMIDFCDGIKLQMACFQGKNSQAELKCLRMWCDSHNKYLLLDGKWGDVPHTMEKYAKNFAWADGVTVSPLFGKESLEPFKEFDGDVFLVADPSSGEASSFVSTLVRMQLANIVGCDVVVGANRRPHEWLDVDFVRKDIKFLTPGVGAQGSPIPQIDNCYIPISRGIFEASDPVAKCKEYYDLIHNT